jgi:hypothetical protein
LYDQASLVVVPSGYKSGKIYAQKPLTTDGQLTFTRASTATRVNASGLIETVSSGVPRLDYQGSTCPKLLLEPQRTNSQINSENFASWLGIDNVTLTSNTTDTASPTGANTATKVVIGSGAPIRVYEFTESSAGTGTISVFAKAGTSSTISLFTSSGSLSVSYNLATQTVTPTTGTGTITSYGSGWYRITATATLSSNEVLQILFVGSAGQTIYIFGAQVEAGAYATSYIPTTSAAVTRLADAASKTGISSLIGQTNGTFFVDVTFGNSRNSWFFSLVSNSWLNDAFYLEAFGASNYIAISTVKNSAGAGSATSTFVAAAGVRAKIAVQYTSTTLNMFINGVKYTGTRTATPACTGLYLNEIGTYGAGDSQYNSNRFNQVLTFTSALTDAQCIELTTL